MGRNARLKVLGKLINEKHGSGTIGLANTVKEMPRLSTGSLSFDRALGGGVPVGKLTTFRGQESSGKTSAAYRVIGLAQKLCANCFRPNDHISYEENDGEIVAVGYCDCYKEGLFITKRYPDESVDVFKDRIKGYKENSFDEFRVALVDVEHDFDIEWAGRLGVNSDRLLYASPDTAEQAIDIYDSILRTGQVDLMVLDSVAAMAPSEEIRKSAEELQQGLQARLMGKFTRKVTSAMNAVSREYHRFPAQIWINQLREKIGMLFGDNRVQPGGKSQLFTANVIVDMWSSKWQKERRDTDLKEDFRSEIGSMVRMNVKTLKNKTAPPLQSGSYDMIVSGENAGQVDELKYFLAMAEKFGLYMEEGSGAKKRWHVGDEKYKTKKDAMARVSEPETYSKMREIILGKMLKG